MPIFTPEQKLILDQIKQTDWIRNQFYFTGGTALSTFYLHHRFSDDLDFFSEQKFNFEDVLFEVKKWAREKDFTFEPLLREVVYMFILNFKNGTKLKVDFGYYPYKRIEKGLVFEEITVDSLLDIAINKLSTVNQRSSVKDFVDLYYLLEKFTLWDLIEGVKIKFRQELDPWLLSSDLSYVVEKFDVLPRMIKPLTSDELKTFFRKKAMELGKIAIEK